MHHEFLKVRCYFKLLCYIKDIIDTLFSLHRDQDEKCTDATALAEGNNELESKNFQRCSRRRRRVPPGGTPAATHPTWSN